MWPQVLTRVAPYLEVQGGRLTWILPRVEEPRAALERGQAYHDFLVIQGFIHLVS